MHQIGNSSELSDISYYSISSMYIRWAIAWNKNKYNINRFILCASDGQMLGMVNNLGIISYIILFIFLYVHQMANSEELSDI